MIESIIQTKSGYRAIIDGVELSIPSDPGNRHCQVVQEAIASGAAVTVEMPPVEPIPDLSFAQLLIGLVSEGWITAEEGRAWRDRVSLPAPVSTLIAALPASQQFAIETRALAASVVVRSDPLVNELAAATGKTSDQLDQFFRDYSGV